MSSSSACTSVYDHNVLEQNPVFMHCETIAFKIRIEFQLMTLLYPTKVKIYVFVYQPNSKKGKNIREKVERKKRGSRRPKDQPCVGILPAILNPR